MAKLKPCKTCGKEVAKSAKKCPHCGQKLKMGFFLKGVIGLVAIIVIAVIASSGGDNTAKPANTSPKSSSDTTKKEAVKPLSNEGVSSDVTIKVTGVEGKPEVGNQFSKEKAQGVFKIVSVSITNNQKDAITLDANTFNLVDDKGREFTYSTSGQTALSLADDTLTDFFLKQLNPGLTQAGKIVFDVPADAKGLKLKARGGMTGEEITLKVE
jgi:RNA polymerase subunit RPABC4/transcription elongation factor Spt4